MEPQPGPGETEDAEGARKCIRDKRTTGNQVHADSDRDENPLQDWPHSTHAEREPTKRIILGSWDHEPEVIGGLKRGTLWYWRKLLGKSRKRLDQH